MNPALIKTLRAHARQLDREAHRLIVQAAELNGLADRMSQEKA